MASLKQELHDIFQALVNERDQLRLEVTQAQEITSLLEMEINAIKSHGDEAFEKRWQIKWKSPSTPSSL
jgi:hypothetical protein